MAKPPNSSFSTYVRLLGYVSRYWAVFFFSVLGLVMHSLAEVAFVDLLGFITDSVAQLTGDSGEAMATHPNGMTANLAKHLFGENSVSEAWIIIPFFLMIISIARGLGYFIGTYGLAYVANYLVHELRTDIFNKYLLLPFRFFDRSMTGHLVSVITYNVQQVTEAGTKAIKIMLQQGSLVIGLLAYLFYVNWKLTLFFLAVMPFIALFVNFVSKRFRRISKNIQSAMGDVTHVTQEAVNGYSEVRMYGGVEMEKNRINEASHSNRRQNMKMALTEGLSNPLVMLLVSLAFAAITSFMLNPVFLATMTTGSFITFLVASGMLIKPIRQLTEVNSSIQRGIAAAESIFDIIDSEEERNRGTHQVRRAKGQFEFKNVCFSYPDTKRQVLQELTFKVNAGETVALVGSSGSGKTSLVSLIPRFYQLESGKILLDNTDICDFELTNLRKQVALVSQNVTLFNDTIFNNIAYGELSYSSITQVRLAAQIANAHEFIEDLPDSYSTEIGDDGIMLSGGQRQRLAIARAVLKDAPILILDEATSSLDTDSERHIQTALERLMENRTTFVIAHRLSTVEKADTILVIENGQVIESGSHGELLEHAGRYADLYSNQFNSVESH